MKLVDPAQMRSEDAANRTWVGGSVGVAAHGAKHRAHVEAGAAANAVQHVALLDVREQFAPAVVEQDDVEFFGPVYFIRLARASNQGVVAGDGLAGACRSQHGPKQREILEARNYFFDAGERDMNARDACAEAAIAFVGGESNHSRIRYEEIGAADSHFG